MSDRVSPHDLLAERSVLGAVLIENAMFDAAEGVGLKAGQFYRSAHQTVWESFGRLRGAGQALDFVTLRSDLERAGRLEDVGGPVYLASLVDGVPRATNVEAYARIVREKAQLRDLIAQANRTIEDAYTTPDVEEVLDAAESRLMAIGRDTSRGEFLLASDWMSEMYRAVDKAATERRVISGVPSGLASIDHLTRGWQPANLIILAARPSDGKSTLMMQCARAAAASCFAIVVSLEMSREELGFRVVALEARVDAFRLMTGHLQAHEMARVGTAMEQLSALPLAVDDAGGQTIAGLCAKVRRLASRHGAGIVFVDYLQLIQSSSQENRTQAITEISGRLKALAKELGVPVVALSQLTRDNAKTGARPELHNLRDGGTIEQDADVVLFIHRPNKSPESGRLQSGEVVELLLAKQRNGPQGRVVEVIWDAPTMRFTDAPASMERAS